MIVAIAIDSFKELGSVAAGAGVLQALGFRLLDAEGRDIPRGGAGLAALSKIDLGSTAATLD